MNAPGYLGSRYYLERLLAQGPSGTVYRALDLDRGTEVALKLIHQRYCDDPRFPVRFREWLRRAARVRHTHLAEIHDYGRLDGRYYVTTELVDGMDVAAQLAHGPIEPIEAARIAQQLCSGLAAWHSQGLVHGGVKPQNILLALDDQVKVTDAGLARVLSDSGLSKTRLLLEGAPYLSPEQARGEKVEPAADIYSAGVVLFEMLTGRLPFESRDAWSLVRMHAGEMPPSPRHYNSRVPAALSSIVMRALQKAPDGRYATGAEMEAALATEFTRGETLLRRPDFEAAGAAVRQPPRGRNRARAKSPIEAEPRPAGLALRPSTARAGLRPRVVLGVLLAVVAVSALSAVAWRGWAASASTGVPPSASARHTGPEAEAAAPPAGIHKEALRTHEVGMFRDRFAHQLSATQRYRLFIPALFAEPQSPPGE